MQLSQGIFSQRDSCCTPLGRKGEGVWLATQMPGARTGDQAKVLARSSRSKHTLLTGICPGPGISRHYTAREQGEISRAGRSHRAALAWTHPGRSLVSGSWQGQAGAPPPILLFLLIFPRRLAPPSPLSLPSEGQVAMHDLLPRVPFPHPRSKGSVLTHILSLALVSSA